MRFLNTETCAFVELDPDPAPKDQFLRPTPPPKFAILSHTWNIVEGEQSYKELKKIQKRYDLKVQCPRHGTKRSAQPSPSPPERPPDTSPLPIPTEGSSSAFAETSLRNPSESHADEITTPRSLRSTGGEDPQGNNSGLHVSRALSTP